MKTMTKIIAGAVTALAIFIGTNVNAQTTKTGSLRFGIGVDAIAPIGGFQNFSNFGLGGTARLQYGVSRNLALTLTSGYYNFFAKKDFEGITPDDYGVVPVKLGIKAFLLSNFYFGAEGGVGFETNYRKDTKLILSPSLGYATQNWDVAVRYENLSGGSDGSAAAIDFDNKTNRGLIALRLAYAFGL